MLPIQYHIMLCWVVSLNGRLLDALSATIITRSDLSSSGCSYSHNHHTVRSIFFWQFLQPQSSHGPIYLLLAFPTATIITRSDLSSFACSYSHNHHTVRSIFFWLFLQQQSSHGPIFFWLFLQPQSSHGPIFFWQFKHVPQSSHGPTYLLLAVLTCQNVSSEFWLCTFCFVNLECIDFSLLFGPLPVKQDGWHLNLGEKKCDFS